MRYLTYGDYKPDPDVPDAWKQRIRPLHPDNLQGIGIDLTVGGTGVNLTSGEEVSFDDGKEMEIRPGDFVNVQTAESVTLEDTDFGMVFAKVSLTRRGFTSFGSKIDPGFRGELLLSFANNGHSIETLRKGESICMVSILILDAESGKPYGPGPAISHTFRPVVTLSLEPNDAERKQYKSALTRAQMELYDLFPKLSKQFTNVQDTVNTTRRDLWVGFLTTTIPTTVIGLLALLGAFLALTTGLDKLADRLTVALPRLPLALGIAATVIAIAALISAWRPGRRG